MNFRPALAFFAAWLCACLHGVVLAQGASAEPASGLDAGLEHQVRQLALEGTHAGATGMPRVEVTVGQLDARLRLAPCQRVEPYVPDGMRLWGKSRIGLRCVQGPTKWNVYLPITVKVFGTALVATGSVPAGSVLAAADLTLAEVDIAEEPSAPIVNSELAVGRTLVRVLKPGQGLRHSHLKARQWFAAGETVTVLAQGEGFSGRVLTGQPVGERRVTLGL
jgi:flagellar basal body P-ring formation protein FlgA